jgi:ribosomal protein S4
MGTRPLFALKHAKRVRAPLWRRLTPKQALSLVRVQRTMERRKESPYGAKLRLRRLLCLTYGNLSARYFARVVRDAAGARAAFGTAVLTSLERRLDVACFRAGFAWSLGQARQRILHGSVSVNGVVRPTPSVLLRAGDTFTACAEGRAHARGWAQGKPLHLEVNYAIRTAVFLYDPQAVYLPSPVDPRDLAQLAP